MMIFRKLPLVTVLLLSQVSVVHASGFALAEQSSSGLGNANSGGAAYSEDSSVVHFNPAGISDFGREQFDVSLHQIQPSAKFTNKGSTSATLLGNTALSGHNDDAGRNALVPNFSYVNPLTERFKFGLGISVPFGLSTKYDDTWVGRYHAVESDLKVININPAISFAITDKLAVGLGANFQYAEILLSNAIDFGALCVASFDPASCQLLNALPQQADGFVSFSGNSGDKLAFGWNWGVLFKPWEHTHIAAAYRPRIKHTFKGEADFTVPGSASFATDSGAFSDSDIEAEIILPSTFSLSFFQGTELGLDLLADITWTSWSSFDEIRIVYKNPNQPDSATTEDWQNTTRFSIGANYHINDTWTARFGMAKDQGPVSSDLTRSARLPDGDRTWLTAGLRMAFTEDVNIELAYVKVTVEKVDIERTLESSVPTMTSTLRGSYESSVDVISTQMNWRF